MESLISGRFEQQLIDDVRPTVEREAELQKGITSRNLARYGATMTPAEAQALERQQQRGTALGLSGALTNTRVMAKDLQQRFLGGLANLGTQIRGQGLDTLMSAEYSEQLGQQAKAQNRAQYKSNIANTLGTAVVLGVMGGI